MNHTTTTASSANQADLPDLDDDDMHQEIEDFLSKALADVERMLLEDDLAAARDPATPAEVLLRLAEHRELSVRKAVTRHPGTPTEKLLSLGSRYPTDFWHNPVFDLLLLEEPNLLRRLSPCALEGLFKRPGFIEKHLNGLLDHPNGHAGYLVGCCDRLTPEMIEQAERNTTRQPIRLGLAEHPAAPPVALERLARDEDENVRWAVAENINTPATALQYLADRYQPENVRRWIARNENTPAKVLSQLAADRADNVRHAVAENVTTPLESLRLLSKEKSRKIHRAARKNIAGQCRSK